MIVTKQLKDLNRNQLTKLLVANPNAISGFNKRTTTHNLRLKFNRLGDEFATVTFNNRTWEILK